MKVKVNGKWYEPDGNALMVEFDDKELENFKKSKVCRRHASTPASWPVEDVAKFMEVPVDDLQMQNPTNADLATGIIRLCENKTYESYEAEGKKKVESGPFNITLGDIQAKQTFVFDLGKVMSNKACQEVQKKLESLLRQEKIPLKGIGCYQRTIEVHLDGEGLKESLKPVAEKIKGIIQRSVKEGDLK